jgi:[ribosomal protein S18]-alanine N-acetyltransferase
MNAVPRQSLVGQNRSMLYADLQEVLTIEKRAHQFPWTEGILRDCIRAGYHCRVLDVPHSFIQGYAVMSAAAGEAHILNISVRPELQGRGLARRMLDHLLELARSVEVHTVFLEVRPSNGRAVRLYSSAGFCEIGSRLGYYPAARGREDALIMAKAL